jgi:hypothetical protein
MKLSRNFKILLLVLALWGMLGENSLLSLLALSVLAVGVSLLWRPGVSPILLFVFGYQWLQASIKIFQANMEGVNVDALSQFDGAITDAIGLSLFSILFLAGGIRQGAGPFLTADVNILRSDLSGKTSLYWFKLYVASFLIASVGQIVAINMTALSQPILALESIKWGVYWAFTYATFSSGNGKRMLWFMVFTIELLLGFGSYFSDFKTILLMTFFGWLPTGMRITRGKLLGLVSLGALTLILAVIWSVVKSDYRNFVSKGQQGQVVSVTYGESLGNFFQLAGGLDIRSFTQGINILVNRISYVDFFAKTLVYVPAREPHQYGALWGDAVLRPFMPRILFPHKTNINDSDRTNQFTGLGVATHNEGTSIGIGYIGESYIDFGYYFMTLPIFLLGFALGRLYKWINNYPTCRGVTGMGFATSLLYSATQIETSITKLIGGLVISVLVTWIVARWGLPYLHKILK